ncbi:protein draper-like [Magallana gigas]|uniref:protein draper-like n=1 Tax=Magallana gigas TaxID=29159 RepID=UPI00333FB665
MEMAAILNVFLLSLFVLKTVTYTQLVNSNTIAVSSSTYPSYVASRTVDGNTDQNHTSCSHTDARSYITEAWLRIDLGTVYSVKSVKLWYRGDRGSAYYNTLRLRGYSLRVSNDTTVPPPESSCYNDPGNVTLPTIVEEDCETTAQYIWIYQSNISHFSDPCPILAICEVQVFGCETGHYGEDCAKKCDHCKNNATCGIQNGECDDNGCASPGYQPPLCKECYTGYYGEDCSKKCDHCKNNTSCEKQYGECEILGCAYSGYQPPLCKGCILGMYGLHCEKNCSRYCRFVDCDRKTGTCLDGCKSGYIGSFCNQTCLNGKYGPNCREICGHCYNNSDCYHGNGTCLEGCDPGYWNHECKTPCSNGRYGQNCQYTCSGNCVNGEACDKTNGSCRLCVDGFQGSKCDRDIRQSPTDLTEEMDIDHLKMERMMLQNQKTEKEIKRLEAETEVLRVRKNVLLRLHGILSELSDVVVQLLNDSKI